MRRHQILDLLLQQTDLPSLPIQLLLLPDQAAAQFVDGVFLEC